jgi:transcriptional regulator with XRE-family HTH domain
MAKRRRYTDEERASAVVMLQSQGYPDKPGALRKVADYMGLNPRTLSRWFNGEHNPPPDNLVMDKKIDLADKFERAAYVFVDHALKPDVIEDMTGQQAMTSAGIAVDKMRLLRGLPTEIVQILPEVVAAIESMGQSPSEVFNRIIERAKEHANH